MSNFTLDTFNGTYTDQAIIQYFNNNIININPQIIYIFNLNMANKNLFPKINLSSNATWQDYITAWITKYDNADKNPPSIHTGSQSQSPYDPVTNIIVQHMLGVDQSTVATIEQYHTLCMQAENIEGGLLEEYISLKATNWIWCKGETVRSIDFYNVAYNFLLQIKNKYNTENSSSIQVRYGTRIHKWCRLKKRTIRGITHPVFCWDELNQIISLNNPQFNPNYSEAEYQNFVIRCIQNNPNILFH